jgi:hypothetical protein
MDVMALQPETRFRLRIKPQLEAIPQSYWVKIQAGSIIGIPDILGCVNGRLVALELKTEEGKATPMQLYRIGKLSAAGAFTRIVRPSNWKQVLAQLQAL